MWNVREINDIETYRKKPCEDRHTGKIAYMKTHRGRWSGEDGGRAWSDTATNRNIKDYQEPPAARKQQNKPSSLEPPGGARPCWYLDFGLLASRIMRE